MMIEPKYSVYYLSFPADSRLPRRCRTKTIPLHQSVLPLRRREFEPNSIHLESTEEKHVWSRWIRGHQHLLFYWNLAAEACQDVTYMVRRGKWWAATLWLRRATQLALGSVGMTAYLHNLDLYIYELLVKGVGIAPEAFDEEASNEYRLLKDSIEEAENSLQVTLNTSTVLPCELGDALRRFNDARCIFEESIATRVGELCAWPGADVGPSLRGEKYDRAFGLCRTPGMFIEDYHFSLLNALGDARKELKHAGLGAEQRAWIEQGDEIMQAIVGELLDPPCYRPDV